MLSSVSIKVLGLRIPISSKCCSSVMLNIVSFPFGCCVKNVCTYATISVVILGPIW